MITHDVRRAESKPAIAIGGRHHVTVLFSDLSASSRLAQAVEPEVNIYIIDSIIAKAVEVIGKHGGVVNQCHGDGVLAVFGFPKIQEDDVRRATEAALELHRVVAKLTFDGLGVPAWFSPSMHSGIDSGLVIIGDGDWIQGQYKVSGPAANTAAALSGIATADEIIASASTLRGVLPFFSTREHAPLALKDKGVNIAAYNVLARSTVSTRFEARAQRGLTAFFGRTAELESLEQALQQASEGKLQIVNIVGAAGLGKSRIVEEFLRRTQVQCRVYRSYCEHYGGVAPLQPFLQMLRQVFKLDDVMSTQDSQQLLLARLAALDEQLIAHQDTLLRMLSLHSATDAAPARLAEPDMAGALIALFATLAQQRPLVLIIDDWQWADEASRQVIGSIIRALQGSPILLVPASRELETRVPAMAAAKVVQLEPFNELESARKIRALLPHSLDAGIARIQQQSGGNALFIEELCDSSSKQALEGGTNVGSSHIPKWLFGLIETRVQQLPEDQARLVRIAAVIGNVVPFWLLERISGYQQQDAIFRQLADNDVMTAGEIKGTLRFKHGITRDAIYELVGQPNKRQLHLQIAQTLKAYYSLARRPEQYETLAYHYAGGGDYARAFCYAKRAGEKAMAASFLGNARSQYLAALDALAMLSQTVKVRRLWIEISLRWALACIYAPARDQLLILQRTADFARELDDQNGLAHAQYWLGYIHYGLGDQMDAIQHCQQALALAEKLDNSRLGAQLLKTLGQSFAAASDYPQALQYLDRAMTAKDRRHSSKSGIPVGSVYAMACKGFVIGDSGNFNAAHECVQWALDAAGGAGHVIEASVLVLRGTLLLWQGRWQEAIEDTMRTQSIAERVSAPYTFSMSRAVGGYARWKLEGATDGIESLRRAAEWLDARETRLFISLPYAWLADALAAAGEDQEAFEYGQRALARVGDRDRAGEAMACRALARVSARSLGTEWPAPEQYLQMALKSAQARGSRHEEAVTQLHQAEVYAAMDQHTEAMQLLTQARQAFAAMDMHWHDALAEELVRRLQLATH